MFVGHNSDELILSSFYGYEKMFLYFIYVNNYNISKKNQRQKKHSHYNSK